MNSRGRAAWRRVAWIPALLLVAALARADEASLDGAWKAARAALLERLDGLAAWAGREQMAGRRDATYELILRADPDHAKARSSLGFRREKDGTWSRRTRYVQPPDRSKGGVPEWEQRVEAAQVSFRDDVLALFTVDAVEAAPRATIDGAAVLVELRPNDELVAGRLTGLVGAVLSNPRLPPTERVRIEKSLEERFSEQPAVRAALGHVRDGERWLLRESVTARERRATLHERTRELLESAPAAKSVELRTEEASAKLPDLRAWETPRTRLYGTVPEAMLRPVAERLDRIPEIFEKAIGLVPTLPPRLVQGSLRTREEGIRVIEAREPLTPEKRKWIEGLQSWWLGDEAVDWIYAFGADETQRAALILEGAFHRWFQEAILRSFPLRQKTEALQEGLATYLTWLVTGTRYSWTVESTYAGTGGADPGKLRSAKFDWAAAASALLEKPENAMALRLSLPKPYSGQNATDALVTYAFAAYLVEGYPDATRRILKTIGEGKGLDAVFVETFGADPERVQRRLARWCREVGSQ